MTVGAGLLPKQPHIEVFMFELDVQEIERANPILQEEPVETWFRAVVHRLTAEIEFRTGTFSALSRLISPFPTIPDGLPKEAREKIEEILKELKEKANYKEIRIPRL